MTWAARIAYGAPPMAARQIWLFLTPGDLEHAVALLERAAPGVVASGGRYLRGNPRALLDAPASLERRESLPGERRLYLLHRQHSAEVVVHPQPAGPFAGWSQIDEERTDALVLRVPEAPAGTLQPAQLYAHTQFWRGAVQTKKRHPFTKWANAALKLLLRELPATSVRFMRVGPEARAQALAGTLRLTYLERTIEPSPPPGPVALPVIK